MEVPKKKILIVDDSEYHVEVISSQLLSEGYEVETAGDGETGLQKVQENPPDLILLDVILPTISGYDVCRLLRDKEESRFIPIILITVLGDSYDKVRGLEAGADDFLVKPLNSIEMAAKIKSLLRRKEQLEKQRERDQYVAEMSKLLDLEQLRREEETKRKQLYNKMVHAVTNGKLLMIERDELTSLRKEEQDLGTIPVQLPQDVTKARSYVEKISKEVGVAEGRVNDLALCVSEAATNIIKHAGNGSIRIAQWGDKVRVWVEDYGPGIDYTNLSKATLMRGYSTKPSLGYGFTIMLECLDTVYLCTDQNGTTVILEMKIGQEEATLDIDRFLASWPG